MVNALLAEIVDSHLIPQVEILVLEDFAGVVQGLDNGSLARQVGAEEQGDGH